MTKPIALLDTMRSHAGIWLKAYFAVLAALLIINIFLRPANPHFGFDAYFAFWPAFGFGVGILLIFIMKRVIQPLIVRKEDYYGDI